MHLVRWDRERMEFLKSEGDAGKMAAKVFGGEPWRVVRATATEGWILAPEWVQDLDRRRYQASCTAFGLTLVVDFLGQVAFLDRVGAGLHVLRLPGPDRRVDARRHADRANVADRGAADAGRAGAARIGIARGLAMQEGAREMNVSLALRRRPEGRSAIALLLPCRDVAALLGLCAGLGLDPSRRTFAVEGGFLVMLDEPTNRPIPGAIRLRALAEHLYLPADSELVPALLDDEAEGLARDRGLVFLPGGRVLGFDPRSPLDPSALLVAEARPRRNWGPLPRPESLAERIEEIVVEWPNVSPEGVFDAGDDPIGTEAPRPDDADPASTLLGKAALSMGRGMVRLGQMLGIQGLSGLGVGWIGKALALAPRLSEDLLGRQAAALRDLLREFREGDLERALRRALPLGEPGGTRGAAPSLATACRPATSRTR